MSDGTEKPCTAIVLWSGPAGASRSRDAVILIDAEADTERPPAPVDPSADTERLPFVVRQSEEPNPDPNYDWLEFDHAESLAESALDQWPHMTLRDMAITQVSAAVRTVKEYPAHDTAELESVLCRRARKYLDAFADASAERLADRLYLPGTNGWPSEYAPGVDPSASERLAASLQENLQPAEALRAILNLVTPGSEYSVNRELDLLRRLCREGYFA